MTQKSDDIEENYDGFYFLPSDDQDSDPDGMKLAFFRFKDDMADGNPIESSHMGDKYHIAFFKPDEEGYPKFDESFEAILADPITYVNNLVGSYLYGCICRKTDKSEKWFEDYLDQATDGEYRRKMIQQLRAIS